MNEQINFYIKNNINGVAYGSNLEQHFKQRANLIQAHLGIPLSLLKGASILEFGPCGGENALFLAVNGARVTLVEPNPAVHKSIRKLFNGFELAALHLATVESFLTSEKFDIVIAEGFLLALPDRKAVLKKILTFGQGLTIVTYSCMYGNFFESLKRYIFAICHLNNPSADESNTKKMDIAKELFYDDFMKLGSARTFESWALDILMNPAGNSSILDDFEDLYQYFSDLNMEIKGCSPNWDMRNHQRWYKDISSHSVIEEWRNNLSFIITGKTNIQLPDADIKILVEMTPLFLDYSCVPDEKLLVRIKQLSDSLSDFFSDIKTLITESTTMNSKSIINIYKRSDKCNLWGMPHHYLLLKRHDDSI